MEEFNPPSARRHEYEDPDPSFAYPLTPTLEEVVSSDVEGDSFHSPPSVTPNTVAEDEQNLHEILGEHLHFDENKKADEYSDEDDHRGLIEQHRFESVSLPKVLESPEMTTSIYSPSNEADYAIQEEQEEVLKTLAEDEDFKEIKENKENDMPKTTVCSFPREEPVIEPEAPSLPPLPKTSPNDFRGTIRDDPNFDVYSTLLDFEAQLSDRNAEGILIMLIGINNAQRQAFKEAWRNHHGTELLDELRTVLEGNLFLLARALLNKPAQEDALRLQKAVVDIDHYVLIEILTTRSNIELAEIRIDYEKETGQNLTDDIAKVTSGIFREILLQFVNGERSESELIDDQQVVQDAQLLLTQGDSLSNEDLIEIFLSYSNFQLARLIQVYELAGGEIGEFIEARFKSSSAQALLAIAGFSLDQGKFFAATLFMLLHSELRFGARRWQRIGDAERKAELLIELLVGRSEKDLANIRYESLSLFNIRLEKEAASVADGELPLGASLQSLVEGNFGDPFGIL